MINSNLGKGKSPEVGRVRGYGLRARSLILPIRLKPKNKQATSRDYAPNKSMLRRVKIFKLTINARHGYKSYRVAVCRVTNADVHHADNRSIPT